MESRPRLHVTRERRRHHAKEALGIGYQTFDVNLPAEKRPIANTDFPSSRPPAEDHPTATGYPLPEEANVLAWWAALLHSLTVMVCVLCYLAILAFILQSCGLFVSD